MTDTASSILFDSVHYRVVALQLGSARITAIWNKGDVSGSLEVTVSKKTPVRQDKIEPLVRIFPNPSRGELHLSCEIQVPVEVRIMDLGGKVVMEDHFTGNKILNVSHISQGSYLVVVSGKDISVTRKISFIR